MQKYFCPNRQNRTRDYFGFTLVEVIVSIFIFSLIISGIMALVTGVVSNSRRQSSLLDSTDQARKVAFGLMQELRNGATASNGSYIINTAADQQFIVFANTGTSIDRIRYYLQSGALYRGVTKYNGTTYNVAQEVSTLVQRDVANGANPLFYYYDGNYNGVANNPLVQPVNVTQVRYVKLNLSVYKKGGKINTDYFTITAGGAVRNLKSNL